MLWWSYTSAFVTAEHSTGWTFFYFIVFIGFPLSFISMQMIIFIVRFAGPKHSATLVGMVDVVGFFGTVPYQMIMGHQVLALGNYTLWLITFLLALGTGMTLTICILRVDEGLSPAGG